MQESVLPSPGEKNSSRPSLTHLTDISGLPKAQRSASEVQFDASALSDFKNFSLAGY
jgi:hypothetical protein